MTPEAWLDIVRTEYLDTFVREGGAAVKVIVPADDAGKQALRAGLRALAADAGLQFATVDGETTRLHMIDKLFHAVARQVDWEHLTHTYLARLLVEQGLRLPEGPDGLTLATVAAANAYPELLLRTEVHRWLWRALAEDAAMSREFRLAQLQLCLALLDPTEDPALAQSVRDWLQGDLRLISTVKRAQIYQRIARHNARHMLDSLVHWLRLGGLGGLILLLDIARYAQAVRPSERGSGFYYSTPAALDAYEVVRQFIDATDEAAYCFIAVTAGPEFLHDERRGLRSYQALAMRVADDVRDRRRQNPLSALVRVAAEG